MYNEMQTFVLWIYLRTVSCAQIVCIAKCNITLRAMATTHSICCIWMKMHWSIRYQISMAMSREYKFMAGIHNVTVCKSQCV